MRFGMSMLNLRTTSILSYQYRYSSIQFWYHTSIGYMLESTDIKEKSGYPEIRTEEKSG